VRAEPYRDPATGRDRALVRRLGRHPRPQARRGRADATPRSERGGARGRGAGTRPG
jgi:hypothetical protein